MTSMLADDDIRYDQSRSALVIGTDGAATAAARRAAGYAGLRILDVVDFDSVRDRLPVAHPDIVIVELAQADPDAADSALSLADSLARERSIDLVVATDAAMLDLAAARSFGPHVQLLQDPDVAERTAALRWAEGLRGHRLHDSARDADERLQRLNAEVARFAQTLSQLAADRDRDRPRIDQVRDRVPGFRAEPSDDAIAIVPPSDVRDAIRARRMRASFFAPELFNDPAWDMLLDLFAAELEHRRVSVSSLCIAAAVPGTTALRWIGSMVDGGLFERYADPHDRRRAFISLSVTAREGMQRYFHSVRKAGLAPA